MPLVICVVTFDVGHNTVREDSYVGVTFLGADVKSSYRMTSECEFCEFPVLLKHLKIVLGQD